MRTTGPKTIYWKVVQVKLGGMVVQFRSNEKNAIRQTMVRVTDDTLRAMVEEITGTKNFILKEDK